MHCSNWTFVASSISRSAPEACTPPRLWLCISSSSVFSILLLVIVLPACTSTRLFQVPRSILLLLKTCSLSCFFFGCKRKVGCIEVYYVSYSKLIFKANQYLHAPDHELIQGTSKTISSTGTGY